MFVFGCAISISTVAQGGPPAGYLRSNHHFPPGRLVIDRVPNFGWNLGFNLLIDGQPMGSIAQGHSFSTWLPAGTHVLTVHKVPARLYLHRLRQAANIAARCGAPCTPPCGIQVLFISTRAGLADARRGTGKITVMVPHNSVTDLFKTVRGLGFTACC